jgi:hypothetical protein
LVNCWLLNCRVLPVFEALPEMLGAVNTQVIDPMIVLMTAVACSGAELLVPLIVAGLPLASLTDALYGRLLIVMLRTPVAPETLVVQLLKL